MPAKTGEETLYVRTSDARYPCASCSFPRIIRIRFPPRDEPQTINQAQNRKIHSSTPPPRGRLPKTGEKMSQVLCERFQRATFHARKKILSTEPALQVQRTRTNNFCEANDAAPPQALPGIRKRSRRSTRQGKQS